MYTASLYYPLTRDFSRFSNFLEILSFRTVMWSWGLLKKVMVLPKNLKGSSSKVFYGHSFT